MLEQQYTDLGFEQEIQISSTNNYPDGFVTADQIAMERKVNLKIIENNGGN